ncbi:MAG: SUMF1/EgtB/PvdO family nonheme iron enzyme [Bacteroidota bacterium]
MKRSVIIAIVCCFLFKSPISANNIALSSLVLTIPDLTLNYTMVQFNVTWDNSWRSATNWDAAWIFAKWRKQGQTTWNHATFNTSGHTAPTGSTITTPSDGKGVLIYRDANGTGNVTFNTAQIRWNYSVDGVLGTDKVEFSLFAIEMCYVPAGSFTVGRCSGEGHFFNASASQTSTTTTTNYTISNENLIDIDSSAGKLWYVNTPGPSRIGDRGDIPAAFPKGTNAFYCMKYEITQGQYVDFLNKLNSTQATNRFPNQNGNWGHTITVASGVYSTTTPYRACGWLDWEDITAYLDWAALRPMTELEYEKACRGNSAPVANECAWGTATKTEPTGISNSGASNEKSSNTAANCNFTAGTADVPLRTGWPAGGTRATAGATLYGIMEMSGNTWEAVISAGNATGRAYTGAHGNGAVDANGEADVANWPLTSTGAGLRGGIFDWNSVLEVGNRAYSAEAYGAAEQNHGGRGVRTP